MYLDKGGEKRNKDKIGVTVHSLEVTKASV